MSNKGNILLVANWESGVGYAWWLMENFWVIISNHFESQNRTCHLIYPKVTHIPDAIASSKIEVSECDFQDHSLANLKTIHKLIKTNKIQCIYLTDSPSCCLIYLLLRIWGIKKIVVHDHTPGERSPATSLSKLAKSTIQHIPFYTADHFVAVTKFVYKRFIEVSCIPENKCSVAPNGIEPIDLSEADLKYAHQLFQIPEGRIIVVTTGRASYYKGIDFFIECANELINKQGHDELHFLFCGDGPDMSAFRALAQKLNLDEHFTFTGKRTDIRKILVSCQIGFHAAIGEVGYSLSILEYMSAGLVTIVPNRPSTSLATTNMVNGILYQPGNIKSATEAISLALDTKNSQLIKHNAISDVHKIFNIKNTNTRLVEILQNVF